MERSELMYLHQKIGQLGDELGSICWGDMVEEEGHRQVIKILAHNTYTLTAIVEKLLLDELNGEAHQQCYPQRP